jgi:hypothetical protein
MDITSYSVINCKVLYTRPAKVRLGIHPVESLGSLAQPDALSSFHPPLKVLIIFHQDCVFGENNLLTFTTVAVPDSDSIVRIQAGQNCPPKKKNMKKMKFITNFFIKNLDPGSAWIRIQQQHGSGISNSLDPDPQQQLGSGSGFSRTPGTGSGFLEYGSGTRFSKTPVTGSGFSEYGYEIVLFYFY